MSLRTGANSVVLIQQISWKVLNCLDIFLGTQDIVKIPKVECFFHKTQIYQKRTPTLLFLRLYLQEIPYEIPLQADSLLLSFYENDFMIAEIWRLKIKNMLKLPRAGHFRRLRTAGFLFLLNCRIRITSPIGDALRDLVPFL